MVGHLNKRLDKTILQSQLQTHALHNPDKPIKIPKMKSFPGNWLIELTRNWKSQTG